jgi:hypothetical protein
LREKLQKNRFFLILLGIAAVIGGIGLFVAVSTLSPDTGAHVFIFYLVLAFLAFSLFTLLGTYLRKLRGSREMVSMYLAVSARQAIWLTSILIISLILSSLGLFTWLNALFLILAFVFFEFYLTSK